MILSGNVDEGFVVDNSGKHSLDVEGHGASRRKARGCWNESSGLARVGIEEEEWVWMTCAVKLPEIKACVARKPDVECWI